jgi:hypothetical protein
MSGFALPAAASAFTNPQKSSLPRNIGALFMVRRVYENVANSGKLDFRENPDEDFFRGFAGLGGTPPRIVLFGFWQWAAAFLYGGGFPSRRSPEIFFNVNAGFDDGNAFGFEELFLERGVWFADQDFAVGAEHAVPRDGLASRSGAHGAAGGAGAAG